jgi:hypothetical protein
MEKKSVRVLKKRVSKAKKQVSAVRTLKTNFGTIGASGHFDSLSLRKHKSKRK